MKLLILLLETLLIFVLQQVHGAGALGPYGSTKSCTSDVEKLDGREIGYACC